MKNEANCAKKLAGVLKRVRAEYTPKPYPDRDPVTTMVVAFLQWDATRHAAEEAYKRISAALVDNNDLRVSHPQEVVELLGPRYPRVQERAARLHEALQEVFIREHAVSMATLEGKPKKVARAYLDTLPGAPPYVASLAALLTYGAHGVPADDRLADLLRAEGAADAEATVAEVSAYLERHVKAEEALEIHLALQAWSDAEGKTPSPAAVSEAVAPRASSEGAEPSRSAGPKQTKKTTKRPQPAGGRKGRGK